MAEHERGPDPGGGDGGGAGWEQLAQKHFGITHLSLPPRLLEDGSPNPEHFRAQSALITSAGLGQIFGTGDAADSAKKININHQTQALERSCVLHGFDPKHIMDARTDAEKALDAANRLQQAPRGLLEELDDELDALEKAFDAADKGCLEEIKRRMQRGDAPKSARGAQDPKAWCVRLLRVRRLRERARHAIPDKTPPQFHKSVEAAHLLRYMVYVGRSSSARGQGAKTVYQIYPHLCEKSVGIWEAEHGVAFVDGHCHKGMIAYEGVMIEEGPGFGKTTIVNHWAARRMSQSPRDTGVFLHAKAEKAKESLGFVANYFRRDNEGGRRNLSLFPDLKVYRDNSDELHMDVPNRTKTPTAQATGVGSAGLGSDHLWQIYDDVVPQDDAEQETERKRRYSRIQGTWMTRLRGKESFWLYTGYPWHKDDATMRLEKLARTEADRVRQAIRSGQKLATAAVNIRVIKIPCGGPNSVPKFKSICPEITSPAKLRSIYHRDRAVYAANYQLVPLDEAMRVIAALRFYDPPSEEHLAFARRSINHLSFDPAATNHDRSDKAGIALLGEGDIDVGLEGGVRQFERRLRVLEGWQIGATQNELVDWFGENVTALRVDRVHVETRGAYVATADMIENEYGVEVTRYDPTNRKKGDRLRASAPMLNDGNKHLGMRACVEFPGKVDEHGNIGPDYARYGALYEQFLDFGTVQDDHLVDSITQVCIELAPTMDIGLGAVSEQVKQVKEQVGELQQRKKDMLHDLRRRRDEDASKEEMEFFSRWN